MADWSNLMAAAARDLRIGGKIVFGSGRELALDGGMVSRLTIEEGADGVLAPGSVLCAQCTLDLANDDGQWSEGGSLLAGQLLTGATLMPRLGVLDGGALLWRDLGVFQVERAAYMEAEAIVRLRSADSIAAELDGVFVDGVVYPATLQEIWEHALDQTRYEWSGGMPNGNAVVDLAPDWRNASLRGALGYVAAAAGCFVRVNRAGALDLCPLWEADAPARSISPEHYLQLEGGDRVYGPVDSLRLKCVDGEAEHIYRSGDSALHAAAVSGNPLFREAAAHRNALAEGMLAQMQGFQTADLHFEWRGDPELRVGDRVQLQDRAGRFHGGVVCRQTLRFAGGFSASCACAVPQEKGGMQRAITPEGGLNAGALTGAVDGALLSVGSVTANKLAAGAITADKLAAGAIDADVLRAITAKLQTLVAGNIGADTLAAELARLTVLFAGTATFDRATVEHLVAAALNLDFGMGDRVFIRNLAVEQAQMIGATIGNLCIKASDGNYYRLDVDEDGCVRATKTSVSSGEISAGETSAGRVILETDITAANLNTGNLLATYALVNEIDAARIDVDALCAREAFIAKLCTSLVVGGKTLTMIAGEAAEAKEKADAATESAADAAEKADAAVIHTGDAPPENPQQDKYWMNTSTTPPSLMRYTGADASNNGWELVTDLTAIERAAQQLQAQQAQLRAEVQDLATCITADNSGVHIYKDRLRNEVLISDEDVQILVNGASYSKFLALALQLGKFRLWEPAGGGLAFGPV